MRLSSLAKTFADGCGLYYSASFFGRHVLGDGAGLKPNWAGCGG